MNEAVKPELSSVKSSDQEDNFKVPDGKPVIKSEPSEPEKSKAVPEDKIEFKWRSDSMSFEKMLSNTVGHLE